jgi:lipopolysaccharide/colanic/teichoic acid biosynthesis glycosyltransferase
MEKREEGSVAVRKSSEISLGAWEEPMAVGSATLSTTLEAAPTEQLIYGAGDVSTTGPAYRITKRFLDAVLSAAGIIALLPLMTVVAILIKLTSPGPVFFRQTRIGRNGIPFTFFKFRSMEIGSEERKEGLLGMNQAEYPLFKMRNDPRVTRVGRAIRRVGIDELPQLWNVVRGDMSLVGPRPHLPEEVREYKPWHWARLEVTPGITCVWQVTAKKELSFNEWIESDLEYVGRQSTWLDFTILARTFLVLFSSDRVF